MKIGLIGINSLRDESHFLTISSVLGKHLHGIFSPQSEDVLPFSKNYKINLYNSTSDLFNDVDAVYFAKSLKPNYDFAINAIKKSCHLFIEDISFLDLDEIKHLYKVAFEAHTKIQIKLTKSFSPEFLKIKELISEPKLIEFVKNYTTLLRNNEYFSELLNNLCFANEIINSGIKKISTLTIPLDKNHNSVVHVRLDYDNGAVVNMKFDNISVQDSDDIILHEKEKVFKISFQNNFAYEQSLKNGKVFRTEFDVHNENAYQLEINHFIDSCKNIDSQNISESPSILKIVQNTLSIMERLTNHSLINI